MPSSPRFISPPDTSRAGLSLGDTAGVVRDEDQALFQAYVNMVVTAPGAAMLVWGEEAICLVYNRAYRTQAGLRMSVLGRPLIRAHPEQERAWRSRLELVMAGQSVPLAHGEIQSTPGAARMGWMLPVSDPSLVVRGALILIVEVTPVVDQLRRVMSAVAGDLRDALVGVRVVTERLSRVPKLTVDRLGADLGRVLELTGIMDRMAEDLSTFSRFAGGSGVQVTLRPQDLGVLVRAACDELSAAAEPLLATRASPSGSALHDPAPPSGGKPLSSPEGSSAASGSRPVTGSMAPLSTPSPSSRPGSSQIRVSVVEVRGAWDSEAIRRIVVNLVGVARRYGGESAEIRVDLAVAMEGALLTVRGESKGGRDEELAQLLESSSPAAAIDRRRSAANLGFFIARELVLAHNGRLVAERGGGSGFVFRAVFPLGAGAAGPVVPPRRP